MQTTRASRISAIWLFLMFVTCCSWMVADAARWCGHPQFVTILILAIAFVKARFIMMDFMEVRETPIAFRLAGEAWIVLVCASVIFMAHP